MRLKPLRRIQSTDKDFNQLQDNLKEFLDSLLKNPLLGAGVVHASLKTGDNLIQHGLGRNYVDCFASLSAPSVTLSYSAVQTDRKNYVNVTASAPCTVAFLVT
jgi:hypothetical protein